MTRMKIVVIIVALICVVALAFFSKGSANVKSQSGCPSSKTPFKVDYFGFPLKSHWVCEITQVYNQGGSVAYYKAGSIANFAFDSVLGLAVVLLPTIYLIKRAPK